MRLARLFAAAALLAAAPAAADVTARFYHGSGPERMEMVVAVNDEGDSRVTMGHVVMISRGGVPYVVEHDAEGIYVARLLDALELSMAEFDADEARPEPNPDAPPAPPPPAPPPSPPPPPVQLIRGGTRTIGGRVGTVWTIRRPDADAPERDTTLVVTNDPELAPIGRAAAPPGGSMPGLDPLRDPWLAAHRALARQGTIIQEGEYLSLIGAEVHPIPASEFILPATPLTRGELITRRHRHRPALR